MFEFDHSKSESNREKHGIDFVEAQALWNDANLLEIPAKTMDETRFLIIGRIEHKHWSAVVTYRDEKNSTHFGQTISGRRGGII